ncbi:Fur family transcriptional regulator [Joostella sp.]|uniref:Fur family transcriptional regulator n=1 Tax=Joostella sp. TaxID=2231138 RepID=UPI003A954E6A
MKSSTAHLEDHKIRPTAMRILILDFLKNNTYAVSLRDIEDNFEKSERTTLYRTLKTFEDSGLVHQINDGSTIPKYALCVHENHLEKHTDLHLHFYCTKCENTMCLTEHKIPQIALPKGYIPDDVNMIVRGICDDCNQE